ncbi:MAG: hypothetical protein NTX61_09720, partial [Bacteroidetes bacterium]|nr:hypothetical protein [Bacteroidota bacterium]
EDGTCCLTGNAGMWDRLTIMPSGNRTLVGSKASTGLIELCGARNVKIDGKSNGTNSLVIENTSTSGQTIRLIAGTMGAPSSDTIVNCTLKGSSTSWGVVSFWELNTTTANNNNYLGNCDIGPSGSNQPQCGVYSFASTNYNNGVTVTGNKIHDFLRTGANGYGIFIDNNGGSNWNISANSFYLTSAVRPTSGVTQAGIYVSSSSSNNIAVTGNYIGGSGPQCTGNWVDTVYNQQVTMYGILCDSPNTPFTASNNTIGNILFESQTSAFSGIGVSSTRSPG